MAKKLNSKDTKDLENAEAQVGAIDAQAASFKNILSLTLQQSQAEKELLKTRKELARLGKEEVKNAQEYEQITNEIENLEKRLQVTKDRGNKRGENFFKKQLADAQKIAAEKSKTAGGAVKAIELEQKAKLRSVTAEKNVIKDINKIRGIGGMLADKFRSKEEQQKRINLARAKAGRGINKGPAVKSSKSLTESFKESKIGAGLVAAMEKLKGPLNEIKTQAKAAIVAPFADAAGLLTGDSFGMGSGKVNASGATSILGGLSTMLKTIPLVGGILGGLTDIFKGIADAVLGMDQANFRVARSMNISVKAAAQMRKEFKGIAEASGNLALNDARLLQSYVEIGSQLGINKELGKDIYENDVNLRDVLGLEAQSRKVISDQAIVTGRNAKQLTESAIGTVASFNKLVGTSFKFSSVLSEASKLTGVMGLTLTKFPEKIYNAVLATKTLGFDLKQLDATASSFLDFEGSISKEMEAQVLTGKDLNLTRAREAALNNDNATLAQEITKNVGSTAEYLKLNRIQQEAIASSVGMTRDGLADVLKNQEIYARASVTDQKGLVTKLELLQKQKKTQEEMTAALGKDGYAMATQLSNAERLTEMLSLIHI